MNIHFIAIGGSAMHSLAIALKKKGHRITGSDDEIFEPSMSRLSEAGLLPEKKGWHPGKIGNDTDAVVLGMHARADNPELLRARDLGKRIYSYPAFLYEQAKDKLRVVIAGSHGKTTTTAMVMHVLKYCGKTFDYMIGAPVDGFDNTLRLSEDSQLIIIEGDEYLSSAIDRQPKFLHYMPHIAVITGIAWDHVNVFPDFENYRLQFIKFIESIDPGGSLIYCKDDDAVKNLLHYLPLGVKPVPFSIHPHRISNGITCLTIDKSGKPIDVRLNIFGNHNLYNISAALLVCKELSINEVDFYDAISSFKGASGRLQLLAEKNSTTVFKDFAHAPSKVKATVSAVKKQYPTKTIIACLELHTYSSLNEKFIQGYAHTMDEADTVIVYFNPHTFRLKNLKPLTADTVRAAFNREDIIVLDNSVKVKDYLFAAEKTDTVFLIMTSGNFNGMDLQKLAEGIIH